MRRIRRIGLAVYLIAATMVVGIYMASLVGPYRERVMEVLSSGSGRIVMFICLAIVAVHTVSILINLLVDRPSAPCMRLAGNPDIEVSIEALVSIARVAAAERDVMVEDVQARIAGRDKASVALKVEAIALTQSGMEDLAHRVQERVQAALDSMLGVSGARVQVRFLPSKTVSVTKEAAGER